MAHNSENGYKIADKLKNHTRSVEQLAKVNSSIVVDNNRYNKNKKFGSMVSRNLVAHTKDEILVRKNGITGGGSQI